MKWTTVEYSKGKIDKAGEVLQRGLFIDPDYDEALEILNNFRTSHGYPINTFNATLRKKLNEMGKDYFVSQRLKRIPSIIAKMNRFEKMKLSRMQDIGGLRAVLKNVKEVNKLVKIYRDLLFQHRLSSEKDYIAKPKSSGYKSYHLVYKYKNSFNNAYDGLSVELQIRTKLQHSWATAVETMGTFLDYSLKSSEGPADWLTYFSLVSSAFSSIENTPVLEEHKGIKINTLQRKIHLETKRLNVVQKLNSYKIAIDSISSDAKKGKYYLITLLPKENLVQIRRYSQPELGNANDDYIKEEKQVTQENHRQVVLVSSSSLATLKKAYPNYFLDTNEFIKYLSQI
ncbi:RelA/SpoT domain protein [Leptospira santarosai str. HAI134]|uniref:RelA/SpoT domain-containing protein n=1 Tax=Leptospira TaxID=171 RepID=UPI0002926013|nr:MULTISPECIES: RelA/SpoT domain-containing protein [Leptospira]EKO76855.1 RelA/SpoT domain protein [Leptospira sp. Fiocruz LV3954]EMI62694.1 RelA/SpoT domain protein [Leptospira sp. Fiocruz LV4135]EMO21309.1 RelA/SpoT domain protein [Leptospira santarosai str. HAI134]EMO30813.1 RelA/SpoT domain protein [Leptospira santarosai str. HAI821]